MRDKRLQMPGVKERFLKQELEVQHSPCCYTQEPNRVWVQLLEHWGSYTARAEK